MNKTWRRTIQSILFMAGAFTFAFLLAEAVHETGHYLAHRLYGNDAIHIHLDPFGGSRMVGSTALPETPMIVTSAAGPLFSLAMAVGCFFILWKVRRPSLLPLLIWGPTAMIQEGVNFSLGLLSPNSDAQWIARSGLPTFLILLVGITLLLGGLFGIATLLPLAGIDSDYPFGRTLLIVAAGMSSLILVRLVGTILTNPEALVENLVPLGFSAVVAVALAAVHKPITHKQTTCHLSWNPVGSSLALGAGMFLCQLFLLS